MNIDIPTPPILTTIAQTLAKHHAQAILVGGSIRDYFLGLKCKDWDIEIYGLATLEELEAILTPFGKVTTVGKSFGVVKLKHDKNEYDFAFPRSEKKIGVGHQGFEVSLDGTLSYEKASSRRDFTINSMGYDILTHKLLDPHDGFEDLQKGIICHIHAHAFKEDPLRVYRAVGFAGRFGFALHLDTFKLCQTMVESGELEAISNERIFMEWNKLLLKAQKPSIGFELMRELGILRYFGELEALIGVPQEPKYHPEGDVWIHTMMSLDAMAHIVDKKSENGLKLLYAILCHDLGKATTTTIEQGRVRAIGHEKAGVELTKSLMYRLTNNHAFIDSLLPFVEHHLKPSQFYTAQSKSPAIRRLATKVTIQELVVVAKADFLGRTTPETQSGVYEAGEWLLEQSQKLKVATKPLEHLLQGRDLIALGLQPSPQFKSILQKVYEMQLEEKITTKEEALGYVRDRLLVNL